MGENGESGAVGLNLWSSVGVTNVIVELGCCGGRLWLTEHVFVLDTLGGMLVGVTSVT